MAELKRTTHSKKPTNPAHPLPGVKPQAPEPSLTLEALAAMGDGELAYIRAFRAAEARHLFPQTENIHPSVQLYGLFAADGSPLMLADSRELVISGAWQNDLSMATVH
jgi:hypothetical protein